MGSNRRRLPPPEQFTIGDRLRIVLGAMTLVLGIVILYRLSTLPVPLNAVSVLVPMAFITAGSYRSWLAWVRYREYRAHQTGGKV